MVEIVDTLLDSLGGSSFFDNIHSATDSLNKLLYYLTNLEQKYLGKFPLKDDSYLVELVYVDENTLNTDKKKNNFFRASLCLAIRSFKMLLKTIQDEDVDIGNFPREHLRSYIFDFKPFVEFFERQQNPDFVFFQGSRNYYTTSQEIRLASKSLFWQYPQNSIFDQKIAFNLAVFSLRQSLEMRFQRICGIREIFTHDGRQKPLRHSFFPDFIKSNNSHFIFPENFSLSHVRLIYNWTNLIVHSGYRPRIWEVQFALQFTQPLFSGGRQTVGNNLVHSVYGAVQVKGYRQLQEKLKEKIDEELSCVVDIAWLDQPEAMVESE